MTYAIKSLRSALDTVLLRDRRRLSGQLDRLVQQKSQGKELSRALDALMQKIQSSQRARQQRQQGVPDIAFPEVLPISAHIEDIGAQLAAHQVVIVCGETGSGKTTQLPKICLQLGRGVAGMIAHTQPRRIAARSVAARIAEELGSELGSAVGFKVRFSDRTQAGTYIKLMTDGMMLAEIQQDRFLEAYDTIIIDEAHERSLNIDFLLGYLHWLLPRRRDLKVIITSATIDTRIFSQHFHNAPVIEVSGRGYPVATRYRPGAEDDKTQGPFEHLAREVGHLLTEGPGDVLVFLSGEREIREAAEVLGHHAHPHTEILPLFSRLSVQQQQRVFAAHTGRRVVLTTNVAETSLTVPGIRYVVDAGLARISRYSHRSKVQRLPIEPISQASAQQRAGRCGRIGPGVCVRLYREDDLLGRPEQTQPEIKRTNLASVILQMAQLRLASIDQFPFIDPPDPRYVNDGYRLLMELGALDPARSLTDLGRRLSRLMVDPRLGRMLLAAAEGDCLHDVLIIVAALASQDPRDRPAGSEQAADQQHGLFRDEQSDFMSYLKLWKALDEVSQSCSRRQQMVYCRKHYLSYPRVREWRDTYRQLNQALSQMGYKHQQSEASYETIHKALLAGLLGQTAQHKDAGEYLGARGVKLMIFPGSALSRKRPAWIMSGMLLETRRLYAHTVARIEPEWIEAVAPEGLLKRHYADPHWEKRRGQVVAFEQASLFGLILYARRRVAYARIDVAVSRNIFIQALAEGDVRGDFAFIKKNQSLIDQITQFEEKTRRRGLVADAEAVAALYEARIPAGILDQRGLQAWLRQQDLTVRQSLCFTEADLCGIQGAPGPDERFPDLLSCGALKLPLVYRFSPGEGDDGVTLVVPLMALDQLDAQRLEWLVPGLLEDKVIALIRSLPKSLRRHVVPARDFAAACCARLSGLSETERPKSLTDALTGEFKRMTGVDIPAEAWSIAALSPHLSMRIQVIDAHGDIVNQGRDLSCLRDGLGDRIDQAVQALPATDMECDSVSDWARDLPSGTLPEFMELDHMGITVCVYPALVDEGKKVALRLLDSQDKAALAHGSGLCKLFMLKMKAALQQRWQQLPNQASMALLYRSLGAGTDLRRDFFQAICQEALLGQVLPRDAPAFDRFVQLGSEKLAAASSDYATLLNEILSVYRSLRNRMRSMQTPALLRAMSDIQGQLALLVFPGFLFCVSRERLGHYPRLLKAVTLRLERLGLAPDKDRRLMLEWTPVWSQAQQRWASPEAAAGDELRWLLEEFRVSLFAQPIKTAVPVSLARIKAAMKAAAHANSSTNLRIR